MNFEEVKKHRDEVRRNILKSFEPDFEKAHDVGDIHPNGKWVWKEYKPGKFDWRVAKKGVSGGGGSKKVTKEVPPKSETNGYQIYETKVKTKAGIQKFYAVPTVENKNNGKERFGDSLHNTLNEAIQQAKENAQQEAYIAEEAKREQQDKAKAEQEAKKKAERNKGKAPAQIMQEARAEKMLSKRYNYADYGVLTRKEYIDKIAEEGRKVETMELDDTTAINKLKEEQGRLKVSAPTFNKNHPKTKRLNEINEILNNKDKLPKKTYYVVYDKNGKSFLEVTKTEYDYYNSLKSKKKRSR